MSAASCSTGRSRFAGSVTSVSIMTNMEEGRRFYVDLLGFKVSDVMDYSKRAKSPEQVAGLGDPNGYFTRYGTDHHSMVLFPKRVRDALGRTEAPGVTVNQITWQVGSMSEVSNADQMVRRQWHQTAALRPGHAGIQLAHLPCSTPTARATSFITASSKSAGTATANRAACTTAASTAAPVAADFRVRGGRARARGRHRLASGYRHVDNWRLSMMSTASSLPRPFKIVRLGPVYFFTEDIAAAETFYLKRIGLYACTEEIVTGKGHRCLYFRCNTEHHSLALFPLARAGGARREFEHSKCAALGLAAR